MNKQIKGIRQSNIIILVVVLFASYAFIAIAGYYFKNPPQKKQGFTPKDFEVTLPKEQYIQHIKLRFFEMPWLDDYFMMQSILYDVELSFEYVETEYIGRYFITAYCPEECGYNGNNYPKGWKTSTDTICHYSQDWREPTTCAIDPKIRKYGEYIMVGDPSSSSKKIYHCEDCGPGVRGCWVDCFVETMDEVRSWNTRYDNVYLVTFKTKTVRGNELYEMDRRMNDALNDFLMPRKIEYYKFGG